MFTLYLRSMIAAKESIPQRMSVLSQNWNNTDYPRRIIIREVFCQISRKLMVFRIFSNNDSTDIFIVQTTIRRYYHDARTEKFIYGTEIRAS